MATSVDEYWERRREITPTPEPLAATDGDHRLALQVDVTDAAVVDRYDSLRTRLGEFDCLRPTPPGELHLTVKTIDRRRNARDDGSGDLPTVEAIDAMVAGVVDEFEPFEVTFPRLNLFPNAVYAEVEDMDALSRLNAAICARSPALTTDRDADQFLPHLTLGHFTGDEEYSRLVEFLEENRDLALPETTVSELSLVEYDVTADWPTAATTLRTYAL